jgi:hypothetical protein
VRESYPSCVDCVVCFNVRLLIRKKRDVPEKRGDASRDSEAWKQRLKKE